MNLLDLNAVSSGAIIVFLFWLTPPQYRLPALTLAGFLLIGYLEPASCVLLTLLSILVFLAATRRYYTAGIALIIVIFIAYKSLQLYYGESDQPWALLGTSYYCLRLLHYLIDSQQGKIPNHKSLHFAAYAFFLPTFSVGPINRSQPFLVDCLRHRFDNQLFISGFERVLFGYAKLTFIANYLLDVKLNQAILLVGADKTGLGAYLLCLDYGLDLYVRFSAYSDIAIGMGGMLGFRIAENFHHPFFRTNISEFWKSWHITLSSWCRDYVFSPIAFHFKHPYVGILASMLILGLWHEFTPRYILWGAYHGTGLVAWQLWQDYKNRLTVFAVPAAFKKLLGWFITFNFVVFSFAITRADSLQETALIYYRIGKSVLCING